MNTKITTVTDIEREIAVLEKRKKAVSTLEHLMSKKGELDNEIQKIVKEAGLSGSTVTRTARAQTHKRGYLTLAIQQAVFEHKKGLAIPEIIEKVKASGLVKNTPSLARDVRATLAASKKRFQQVERGVYKSAGKLDGALFDRLQNELAVA